jgi:hypothetical protein
MHDFPPRGAGCDLTSRGAQREGHAHVPCNNLAGNQILLGNRPTPAAFSDLARSSFSHSPAIERTPLTERVMDRWRVRYHTSCSICARPVAVWLSLSLSFHPAVRARPTCGKRAMRYERVVPCVALLSRDRSSMMHAAFDLIYPLLLLSFVLVSFTFQKFRNG